MRTVNNRGFRCSSVVRDFRNLGQVHFFELGIAHASKPAALSLTEHSAFARSCLPGLPVSTLKPSGDISNWLRIQRLRRIRVLSSTAALCHCVIFCSALQKIQARILYQTTSDTTRRQLCETRNFLFY